MAAPVSDPGKTVKPAQSVAISYDANVGSKAPESMNLADLHGDLSRLSKSRAGESLVRAQFRKLLVKHARISGVGHVQQHADGTWDMRPSHATGRVPRRNDFTTKYAKTCNSALERDTVQVESFLDSKAIFVPVNIMGEQAEVLLVTTESKNLKNTVSVVNIVAEYFALWLKDHRFKKSRWQIVSMAAVIDLVSQVEEKDDVKQACETVVNELARHIRCDQVIIALAKSNSLDLRAISGQSEIKRSSDSVMMFETALSESLLRDEPCLWPAEDGESPAIAVGHKQLSQSLQKSVLSFPLRTPSGVSVGAILMTGSPEMLSTDRLKGFCRAMFPRIASAINSVSRAQPHPITKVIRKCWRFGKTIKGLIATAIVGTLVGLMCLPVTYRIRCNCELEPTSERHAVAPFEGLIKESFVEPGERVQKNQLLARMDDEPIKYELAAINADLYKSTKQREVELARREVSNSMLAEIDATSLTAQRALLELKRKQIEIRSPRSGVVISGSTDNLDRVSVQTGETLFSIADLTQMKIELNIPAEEVAHIKVGHPVRIWIEGFEDESFVATIEMIHPRSEMRESKNVFVAEVKIDNSDDRFRPGMKGKVRIDCGKRILAWNLFHKPWNYVKARMVWW